MKKFLALLLFFTAFTFGQNPKWITYFNSKGVNSLQLENNIIWATTTEGLIKFKKSGVILNTYDTTNSGLPIDNLQTIAIDGVGNKWIGTYLGGLVKFDDTKWTVFNTSNSGLPHNAVTSIYIDRYNNKWIGTLGGGLAKFDDTKWTVYNTSNSALPNNYALTITEDSSGNKWIGTYGGIAKFNDTTWTIYNSSNSGLPIDYILAIRIDGNGTKWIATSGEGLVKFNDTSWTDYLLSQPGYPQNYLTSIAIENNKNIWVGSNADGGLSKFDGNNWTVYNDTNSGLPGNYVYSIVIDSSGDKWLATNGGLAVFNENGIVTKIENPISFIPTDFALSQNYPNPFNPTTTINYSVPKSGLVTIKVYDILGRQVRTLVHVEKPAGNYSVKFSGNNLSSGIYFYRMQSGAFSQTKKLILLK